MQIQRVGVIGGGQLAWMMREAAEKLGVELIVQTPSPNDPAVTIADGVVFAPVDDAMATSILAKQTDVITFENEFVDLEALSNLVSQGVQFRPPLGTLVPLLDKYQQRCYLQNLNLPVPKFIALDFPYLDIDDKSSDKSKITEFGFPVVLKARRHGYDGQGTFIIRNEADLISKLHDCSQLLPQHQPQFLLEEYIPFEKELAIIAARSPRGEVVTYPVVETQQEKQVCRRVIAPADITPEIAKKVEDIAYTLLNSLGVVGVFGIELFQTVDGKILVNEIAPRTHNSGHFSLDACYTSQFEQLLRAICDLPLGKPDLKSPGAVMINLLGYENSLSDYQEKRQKIQQIPHAFIHWYGKKESRPGRKLGHVTVLLESQNNSEALAMAQTVEDVWYRS
jgi:5-(carboxyamino)imidazole ribonucleotide synthase